MTTVPAAEPAEVSEPDRHYMILEIVHNDNGTATMEVLFYEDSHTLRFMLWLPDDPAKVDQVVRDGWPHNDFAKKKAAAAKVKSRLAEFKSMVTTKTPVKGLVVPTFATASPTSLGVQRPAGASA